MFAPNRFPESPDCLGQRASQMSGEIEMLFLKSCPKCTSGAVYSYEGLDGLEYKCVNCAYLIPSVRSDVITELAGGTYPEFEASA